MSSRFNPNPLSLWDSYKDTQFYPDYVTEIESYFEARGGEYPYTVFYGLQGILQEHFTGQFFTRHDLDEMSEDMIAHFGRDIFPYDMWEYVLTQHGGRLPVEIRAVREGSVVPTSNVLFTVRDTDPKLAGIGQKMETVLMHVWYTTAVATKSRVMKEMYKKYLLETADDLNALPFQLHDFGFRGATGVEAAARGGAAHLINFLGSDTKVAMQYAHQFYRAPRVSGYSVVASEHSMMTLEGKGGEAGVLGQMLDRNPTGIISVVGDSYDIFSFAREIMGREYRDRIKNRDGKVVLRPDSGDPVRQVPELLSMLATDFGYRENTKGYMVLPPVVGLLWGDGMDYYSVQGQLRAVKFNGFSTENVVNGMGGGLLQKLNRDTQRVAIKVCNAIIRDKSTRVFKLPKTDSGKSSKGGKLALLDGPLGFHTVEDQYGNGVPGDKLETVFLNGELTRFQTQDEIRKLAEL